MAAGIFAKPLLQRNTAALVLWIPFKTMDVVRRCARCEATPFGCVVVRGARPECSERFGRPPFFWLGCSGLELTTCAAEEWKCS